MPEPDDLASLLTAAILEQREQINASRLARGEAGRVELLVNLQVRRVGIQVVIEDRLKVA